MIKRKDNPLSGYYGPGHDLSFRRMSGEEERELFQRYHRDNDFAARDEVIKNSLLFVAGLAIGMAPAWMPVDDVVSAANRALMKAVEKFDYTQNTRFAAYVRKFVRGEIVRGCRDTGAVDVPNGRPTCEVVKWDDLEILPKDTISGGHAILQTPFDETADIDGHAFMVKCVQLALNDKSISRVEKHIVEQHFFKGLTFQQIADRMPRRIGRRGLTRSRIQQIKCAACRKMKAVLARNGIEGMV
jgi:RNA polymerase sigma factor (sigma-70 family)